MLDYVPFLLLIMAFCGFFCLFVLVDFEFLDLASQNSVCEFVRRFKKRKLSLHILINNGEFSCLLFLFLFR